MSSGQRGRGRGSQGGRGDGQGGGGSRGRGDSSNRGDSRGRGDSAGRGDSRGRGAYDRGQSAGRGRGDGRGRGGGGPPGAGGQTQLPIISGGPPAVPDATVTAAENALVLHTKGVMINGFPGRREYGTQGRATVFKTNRFEIKIDPKDVALHRYEVDTGETSLSKDKRRRLVNLIVHNEKFKNVNYATDYANVIVTAQKLDLGPSDEWIETVIIPPVDGGAQATAQGAAPEFVQQARARNSIKFRVHRSDSFSLRHIIDYQSSTSPSALYQGRAEVIQMLNIIIAQGPQAHQYVANVGQNRFYPFENHPGFTRRDLTGGLQALRGYFGSVRPAIGRLLLNINVTSGAFYKPLKLTELLRESGHRSLEQQEAFIRMLKVTVEYQKDGGKEPAATKTRTIVGYARPAPGKVQVKRFGNAQEVKFSFQNPNVAGSKAQQISVFDYFRQHRGITLQEPNLPVLNVGTRTEPQYIPQELCTVLAGQSYRKIVGTNQASEMLRFAARTPAENAVSIAGTQTQPGDGLKIFKLAPPQAGVADPQPTFIHPFGFGVGTSILAVPGRILTAPQIHYAGGKSETPHMGSWNLKAVKFAVPGKFGKWQVVVINRREGERSMYALDNRAEVSPDTLFQEFAEQLSSRGLVMGQRLPPQTVWLSGKDEANRDTNNKTLQEAFEAAKKNGADIVLIILPDQDKWTYSRIKYYCDVQVGIHSVNVFGSKLQKARSRGTYYGNLALKFNIKGGGVSHRVSELFQKPLDNNTMLIGVDVTHPSPGSSESAPSIAAVVASIDQDLCQWPGSIRTQTARQEMVEGLEEMVIEHLKLWHNKNKRLPNNVILYRDGVSEGQYQLVLTNEVPAFEGAFTKLYGDQKRWPKLAVLVVGKRHHTRFYPTKKEDSDGKSGNPAPGTVVDRGIVDRNMHEMYLQAHQGLQGTARPAHYVTIKDEIGLGANVLEQFTHKMCYLFNRATKAVSICPPAYYADLLCERGRNYLFSKMGENTASEISGDTGLNEWTRGVHPRLAESTWYI